MRSVSSPLLIVALAVLFGASIDAGVKYFAASVSVVTLMAWRFLIGGAALVSIYISHNKPAPSWKAIRFHTLRGAVQLTAALTFFWSLTESFKLIFEKGYKRESKPIRLIGFGVSFKSLNPKNNIQLELPGL